MRNAFKFLMALLVTCLLMLVFRALAFTIYTVPDKSLEPQLLRGDRVMVNRWSYGLRTGGSSFFRYSRVMRRPVRKGDFIAFDSPDSLNSCVVLGRVCAVPGDTITAYGKAFVIPADCQLCEYAVRSHYLVHSAAGRSQLLVPERNIIGRAFVVVYNLDGYHLRRDRLLRPIP